MKNKLKNEKIIWFGLVLLFVLLTNLPAFGQIGRTIRGTITDEKQEPVIGASVVLKGNNTVGTATDINGIFFLTVPAGNQSLVISYLGMKTKEVNVSNTDNVAVIMEEDRVALEEVVIVGYGQQKKTTVVGAITQVGTEVLERSGGVPSLGQALTGNLPGVTTISSTGMPGDEDPMIVIRSRSTWNNTDPLILVDGIERPINTVDISSVESISVLKDASATAVYGVKGANGVILITTKRGSEGKAVVQVRASSTMKLVSSLPTKLDAYDTFILKNDVLMRELMFNRAGWSAVTPKEIINKYRFPANDDEWERYPNVDWEDELFKKTAMAYNVSTNVSGGTDLVKYFAALDYQHEGDVFKELESHRGYQPRFAYDRLNVRSNLDFNLTKTTKFSSNLFGSYGLRTRPWDAYDGTDSYWKSIYRTAPDAFRPIYLDGSYGYHPIYTFDQPNSVRNLAVSGIEQRTIARINTDFVLRQDLGIITKGLSAKGTISLDNEFEERRRGINDQYNDPAEKYVAPDGTVSYLKGEDFVEEIRWSYQRGDVERSRTYRRTYYSAQFDYARNFGLHNVTALGLFSREENARGSEFRHYREDWVFRATYNYASKYLFEANGAYNGSEKFGPGYRFAFFPSLSLGWTISEESFVKNSIGNYLDMLKVRASWGKIGNDNISGRWLYMDQWARSSGDQRALMGEIPSRSIYDKYRISALGNPNLSWETVEKRNLGFDYAFLGNLIAGSVDIFNDHRTDILIGGGSRAVPSYFGVSAPTANLGEVKSSGYEVELRLNHVFSNKLRVWVNANLTHAVNKVLFRDDPELTLAHRKAAGYKLGQQKTYIDNGFIKSWDDLYSSTVRESGNTMKLPGDYFILDFDGDGLINDNDRAAYQYSDVPENTYSISVGSSWKGFSVHIQFYGVNGVSRTVDFPTFWREGVNVAYDEGKYWTLANGGDITMPRSVNGNKPTGHDGTQFIYDGSYIRLKNAEIAYTLSDAFSKKLKMKSCKIFLNGDNLLLWTKMPDDRENNFSGGFGGAYPTVRRFNLGLDITF